MAISIFMKIDAPIIAGNSTAKNHIRDFEVFSLNFGAVGTVAKNPSLGPVTVTLVAYNGPRLLAALDLAETHVVTFEVINSAGGTQTLFETITLTGAKISRFQESMSSGEERPVLELAFSYAKIDYKQADINFTYTHG